jgi:hypothetical protein
MAVFSIHVPPCRSNKHDITGRRFGRLTAVGLVERVGVEKRERWLFRCDCGEYRVVRKSIVRAGRSKSCGCLKAEFIRGSSIHGLSKTKLAKVLNAMISRCHDPNVRGYKDYGGRGITVCPKWRQDRGSFYIWAFANGYAEVDGRGLHIDRIDNNQGYSPENCRFVTPSVNCNNTRANRRITFRDENKTITEWSRALGLGSGAVAARLKRGWTVEEALTLPRVKGMPGKLVRAA